MQSVVVRRRFGTLILNSLSQTRSSFSSVSVAVPSPTPTALPPPPPPITESALLRSIESSQRHFIEHLAPHLTPSILPSDLTSFDLTTRCFSFCTLHRFSYPKPSVHRLLHPLILTGAANPESIFNELARTREFLNVNTTSVFDALIRAYCELKKPDEALKSFYLMKEKGFLPKIETCNDMLKLFLKLNRNQAEEFIRHMDTLGLKPAIYEYNTLLHYGGDKFQVACVMFQTMNDSGLCLDAYSSNSYNFVMYKEGQLEEAASDSLAKMLESESESGLVPHALTYDALIHQHCSQGIQECSMTKINKAIAYKDEMISRGIDPTLVTYTLLIEVLFDVGRELEAEDLIKEMQEKGLKPDVYTYNTFMTGYARRKYRGTHISLYDEMVEKRIQPNHVTYNNMILGYCKYMQMEEAQKRFDEMKTRGIKPDYISCNFLICGCFYEKGGAEAKAKKALRVRDEMLKMGFDPTITTYDGLIGALCSENEFEHAEELLKEMISKGICTTDDLAYQVLKDYIKETADLWVAKAGKCQIQEDP